MELPWKKWVGIDEIVDISPDDDDEELKRPFLSSAFSVDGTPRVINTEAVAAARVANEAYAQRIPVHVLAELANPRRRVVVEPISVAREDSKAGPPGGKLRRVVTSAAKSALPAVAAVGLAGLAGRKVVQLLRVEREEPLWVLKNLDRKSLECTTDSPLLRLLPEEVLLAVTSKLGIADRLRLASTCRKLYHVSTLPSVWTSVDLSNSGSAVSKISDKELWRLVRRGAELADDVSKNGDVSSRRGDVSRGGSVVSREPAQLKGRRWREEVLKEEAVVAPPANGGVGGGANQGGGGGLPGGIILASINQLRDQQGQEVSGGQVSLANPPPPGTVVDATWGYGGSVEENGTDFGKGDLLSTKLPLKYVDVTGCSQISRECLTGILAQSASSLGEVRASGAAYLDRRGVDFIVRYGIKAEVDVELAEPNKVEWRMLLMNLRRERDQNLRIRRLLLKDAPLARIDSRAWKVLFQMSILHNMRLSELHLDRCVLRPSDAVTVLEAVQHNVGLHTLRITRAAEGIFENVLLVQAALTAMLRDNTTLRTFIVDETRMDDECVRTIISGVAINGLVTGLGLSRIKESAFVEVCAALGPGEALTGLKELRLTGSKLSCRSLQQHVPIFQNSSRKIRHLELDVNTSCDGRCVTAVSRVLDRNMKLHRVVLTVHYEEMTRGAAAALVRLMKRHGKRVTLQTPVLRGYKPVAMRDLQLATLDRAYKESRPRLLFGLFVLACAKLTLAS